MTVSGMFGAAAYVGLCRFTGSRTARTVQRILSGPACDQPVRYWLVRTTSTVLHGQCQGGGHEKEGATEMAITYVFAGIPTAHYATALPWYERLFGRAPDMLPQDEEAAWQLTNTGWIYLVG